MPRNTLTDQELNELTNRYSYHSPKDDQPSRYAEIREKCLELAVTITKCAPHSRERSTAYTLLDQVMMSANAAIARNE